MKETIQKQRRQERAKRGDTEVARFRKDGVQIEGKQNRVQ